MPLYILSISYCCHRTNLEKHKIVFAISVNVDLVSLLSRTLNCIGETIKTFPLLNKCEARHAAAANAQIGSGIALKKRIFRKNV